MFAWMWKLIVAFMVWLSADRHQIATEPARCAAAVAAARAVVCQGADPARKVEASVPAVEVPTVAPAVKGGESKTQSCASGTCPPRAR